MPTATVPKSRSRYIEVESVTAKHGAIRRLVEIGPEVPYGLPAQSIPSDGRGYARAHPPPID
jgi:hypothetical protein